MTYSIQNTSLQYSLNAQAQVISLVNLHTGHEYVKEAGNLWKLLLESETEEEICISPQEQKPVIKATKDSLTVSYPVLVHKQQVLDIYLQISLCMEGEQLIAASHIENQSHLSVMEIQVTAASGIHSLSGNPKMDAIAWPKLMGMRIENPAESDLSVYAGFRKYERHDQYHTDLDATYPARMSMSWYDLYTETEGLYVGSHDATQHTICMHVERDVKTNLLSLGVCRYPFLQKGESFDSPATVYVAHAGDWHYGARIYRDFVKKQALFTSPKQPVWAQNFHGWLRIIFQPQHRQPNFHFSDIPRLYDQAAASGMNTLFLLGWEEEGFARRWPDYAVSNALGGEEELRKGLDYIHAKGGKALMFLSYSLIDHKSAFYQEGKGKHCTIIDAWGEEVPFAETYCGEGTYRKMTNPPMPMYLSCPGSDDWQQKLKESAQLCLDLGCDGVLFDLGGLPPYFCFSKEHTHAKPSHSFEQKSQRLKELRDLIHAYNSEAIILQEHTVDIFNQHMDIIQGTNHLSKPNEMIELYRYTFPELIITNREMGQDESNYRNAIGKTFLYGLRFDMTVFRCCGTLEDIPAYAKELGKVNALRTQNKETLLEGYFCDEEGFTKDNDLVLAKSYRSRDNRLLSIALFNPSDEEQTVCIACGSAYQQHVALKPFAYDVYTVEGEMQ